MLDPGPSAVQQIKRTADLGPIGELRGPLMTHLQSCLAGSSCGAWPYLGEVKEKGLDKGHALILYHLLPSALKEQLAIR